MFPERIGTILCIEKIISKQLQAQRLIRSQVVALQPTPKEAIGLLDLDHRGL